jgi:CDP-diglyceride synthetase
VDNGPDHPEDDVTRVDVPVTRPEPSGPVRIAGAELAGEAATAEIPEVKGRGEEEAEEGAPVGPGEGRAGDEEARGEAVEGVQGSFDQPSVRLTDQPGEAVADATAVQPVVPGQTATPAAPTSATELPHWTEPPTGEVPAVLSRGHDGEREAAGIIPPSWREEDADWVAHEGEFEPSMFGGEHASLGSLDESDRIEERRPWEFELQSQPGTSAPSGRSPEESGAPTEALTGLAAASAEFGTDPTGEFPRPAAGSGVAATPEPTTAVHEPGGGREGTADEELFDTGARPSGAKRQGRTRRSVLRPGLLRAKRPEDVGLAEAPLAAEPPGAAVTEVPGAGRKRVGLAGLAAADRTAEREAERGAAQAEPVAPATAAATAPEAEAVAAGAATGVVRRRGRGAGAVVSETRPTGTGGGPPARRRPLRPPREGTHAPAEPAGGLALRIGTGIAAAVVAIVAFELGTVTSLVLCVVVVTFAAGECFGVLRRAGYHPATLLGLVGTISLMVGAYVKGVAALPLILALITVFTLLWYVFGIEQGSPVAGTAATLFTICWVSLLGSFAGLLLAPSLFPNRHGIAFLVGAVVATVANDVGALVVGRWIGRRPLAPTISPNKTWEGVFGGAAFSIVISAVVVGNIHPWTTGRAALLGLVVAVVAPVGDLCESLLKRDLRLKDMGRLLPGHGGVLDRVDALLFVLPATYYLVRALNIA